MSQAQAPTKTSRREMRKTLVCLRMEMHRQEIRRDARQIVSPMARIKGMGKGVTSGLGIKHAPLWGIAGVALLGFITGRRARAPAAPAVAAAAAAAAVHKPGGLTRAIRLTTTLMPLIRMALRLNSREP
ncbi:hypothetical protein [Pseudomonas sp. dw_358]|uniref:hypothetical protein n=1 Tax=Pseudomonas sp. dw_358 TaxID=2720083 RepID=UPI001BD2FB97|nr:hypothetical protein [Pseudomonas sp. dw_358]